MLVATWEDVPASGPTPDQNIVSYNIITKIVVTSFSSQTTTFQGILITDLVNSYAVFTYYCGDLMHSNGPSIGFGIERGLFANHHASFRESADKIACLNQPTTPWVNIVYNLTNKGENE